MVRCVHVAGSDAEARSRVFSAEGAYRYYFSYLFGVLKRANRLAPLKPRPDMPDDGRDARRHHRGAGHLRLAADGGGEARGAARRGRVRSAIC